MVRRTYSQVWKFFPKKDRESRTATCVLCDDDYTYRNSITDLKKHLLSSHNIHMANVASADEGDMEKIADSEEIVTTTPLPRKYPKKSIAWRFFDKVDSNKSLAKCRICNHIMSYRTGVSNLVKHVQRKHLSETAHIFKVAVTDRDDGEAEEHTTTLSQPSPKNHRRRSIAWKFFEKPNRRTWTAKCKICSNIMSYKTSVTNLMKHIQRKHSEAAHIFNDANSDQDEDDGEEEPSYLKKRLKVEPENEMANMDSEEQVEIEGKEEDSEENLNLVSTCAVGSHFKCLSTKLRISMCLICNERFSSLDVKYLRKHLIKRHPYIKITEKNNDADSTATEIMYEFESNHVEQQNDDSDTNEEKDNLNIHTVYLDDSMVSSPEPPRKGSKIGILTQAKLENSINFKRSCERPKEMPKSVQIQMECEKCKNVDSLVHFGTYMVSLMRELPKNVSNQLQSSFVKLIMDAQLTQETQLPTVPSQNSTYSITIDRQRPVTGTVIDLPIITLNNNEENKIQKDD